MPPVTAVDQIQLTYDAMAPWDEHFHDHPRFSTWVSLFKQLIDTHRPAGSRLLDIGCGTGRSSAEFAGMGYDVTAYDLSPGMIARARSRWDTSGATFLVGDLRDPPPLGTFDVVVSFNEAFAHLDGEQDLAAALSCVADQLNEGGVLIFDLATLGRFRADLAQPYVVERPDFLMTGESDRTDFVPDMVLTHRLNWFAREGHLWRRESVDLTYRQFSVATVRRAALAAGLVTLRVAGLYKDQLIDDVDEESQMKACYLIGRAVDGHGS